MSTECKDIAIKKISEMPKERVSKVLIFMAGLDAGYEIKKQEEQPQQTA